MSHKSVTEKVLAEIEAHPSSPVHDPNGERWLVSYADMMTLLFGFFALLYALSDEPKDVAEAIESAFKATEAPSDSATPQTEAQKSDSTTTTSPTANLPKEKVERLLNHQPCRACFTDYSSSDDELLRRLKSPFPHNAIIISDVEPAGPAATAGMLPGDILTAINGLEYNELKNQNAYGFWMDAVKNIPKGGTINVDVYRNGERKNLVITLDQMDSDLQNAMNQAPPSVIREIGGMKVSDLNDLNRVTYYIPTRVKGILVHTDTHEWMHWLHEGDVITEINGAEVKSVDELAVPASQIKIIRFWSSRKRGHEYTYPSATSK